MSMTDEGREPPKDEGTGQPTDNKSPGSSTVKKPPALPAGEGLLALIYAIHTDADLSLTFRTPATIKDVLDKFDIDPETRKIILALGASNWKDAFDEKGTPTGVEVKRNEVPDQDVYMELLKALYMKQLGTKNVFSFSW